MKKILLIPAVLAFSTSVAFAQSITTTSSTQSAGGGSSGGSSSPITAALSQQFGLTQTVGDTSKGGFALNKGLFVQAQVPVNQSPDTKLAQSLTANQTIGNTSEGAKAINKATVIQAQIPLSFSAP